MFEAVNNLALNTQGLGYVAPPQSVIRLQPVNRGTASDVVPATRQAEESRQVTEVVLKELEQDIQAMHNVRLKFSKHDDTGRTMIKVMDKENDQVIREIPSEDVLNLSAKMGEMIGILFDKEV